MGDHRQEHSVLLGPEQRVSEQKDRQLRGHNGKRHLLNQPLALHLRQLHDSGRAETVHRVQEFEANRAVRHGQRWMSLASLQHTEPDDSDGGLS